MLLCLFKVSAKDVVLVCSLNLSCKVSSGLILACAAIEGTVAVVNVLLVIASIVEIAGATCTGGAI